MKKSLSDIDVVIRNRVLDKNEGLAVTFDQDTMEDVTSRALGDLTRQDSSFIHFHVEMLNSRRVGPTQHAPTRYFADLYIGYFTKNPSTIKDVKLQEQIANWFAEQTIDGVRFRTFTPFPKSKEHGFTQYLGVIDFDFELYRGA